MLSLDKAALRLEELVEEANREVAQERAEASSDWEPLKARTIHYYINIGLLPGPTGYGRQARYSRDHVNRLRLIKRLQEAHLPLSVIKDRLDDLTAEEVLRELAGLPDERLEERPRPKPAQPRRVAESAGEYIARVLTAQQPRRARSAEAPPREPAAPQPAREPGERWRRLELAPGVELHVRDDDNAERQALAKQLAALAAELFKGRNR
jgi:DNA-binding transcriptional MerR regulator